ncbi:hypothetical protein [Marinigracilibium pacificum]|uniref:Uncharacterized protein n=1 Tax=Marinigracilibium pacificum TaxID=2729599 RepID=A0A848J620_9BACT|nr:hypothetical protein [Marinigracilibium pacificum]NMM49914.1 hypothetical protein [Marinigracilibium pacificum]
MATPIENFIIHKERAGKMNIQFDYASVAESFDTAMVLLVEQDHHPDHWSLRYRNSKIWTSGGWMDFLELDFYNESYHKWWNEGSSAGNEDDTGNRKRIRKLPTPLGYSTVSFGIMYYQYQIDENNTSTTPEGLEFYAMAGIVSTVAGRPVSLLGEITHSNQIAGA